MKKFSVIGILLFVGFIFLVSCDQGSEPHNHEYVNAFCSCGEMDPNHQHEYINGSCICGKKPAKDYTNFFETVFSNIEEYIDEIVVDNLNLPTKLGSSNLTISYKSNNPEFLTDSGQRIDHEFDEKVSLTCTLERDGQKAIKTFEFISLGISYSERVVRAEAYIKEFIENTELVEGLKLPTELPVFGGRIRWIAEDPTLIYDYETLHLPKEAKTVRLMAEILFPLSAYKIVTIPVELNARPKEISDLDYIKTFIETVYAESKDYMFFYDGTLAALNRSLIINVEDDLKETFYTYKTRPAVSQKVLDERVYPGYVIPNEENVLWIVVHDTGLSTVGVNAERLAQNQWNSAYIGGGREASWTYTVDDFGIYQSYEDTVTLWHATDGRSEGGGNLNGIGIEMCVNADGNFEACTLNDARLIGHLLKTYNLGMINMKQHYDFYPTKNCPQVIRDSDRWFEFITLCAQEYISQTLLTEYEISYEFEVEGLKTWPVEGMYDLTEVKDGTSYTIKVTVNGESFEVESIKK